MIQPPNLPFNPKPASILHLDINSCFATIEQQANPLLRHRPIAVAAYNQPSCCIIAPSIEAKRLGIKVGTRVEQAKAICPNITILEPDPDKYRFIHHQLKNLLDSYATLVTPKSIDEFALDFSDQPSIDLPKISLEIKQRIKQIGEYITVSIGLGPSRFLAKTAAGLHKPDGLDQITIHNFYSIYNQLKLTDLNGINLKNQARLNLVGIYSVLDFYNASYHHLFSAFRSVLAQYWFTRLRGYEVDDRQFDRKSFGHSYVLPQPLTKDKTLPIIQKLTHKAALRLRRAGFQTQSLSLGFLYADHTSWHQQHRLPQPLFNTSRIFKQLLHLSSSSPNKPIKTIFISLQSLVSQDYHQLSLFQDSLKDHRLTHATDLINHGWGDFTITPARMLTASQAAPDRIAFGQDLLRKYP